MAYENIDQAVVEFEAKLGYDILSLSWEANTNKLPKTENAILLIPCHAYLYTDHSKKKGAITHRAETDYVKTNQGWLRPSECLTKRGEQQGTYARIWWGVDDWGRFWFYHWIEK